MRSVLPWLILSFVSTLLIYPQTSQNEFKINTISQWGQTNPTIAADEDGNFVAVWASTVTHDEDSGLELTEIYARIFDKYGNSLGPEFQVNTTWPHLQEQPVVAVGNNGNFVITWVSYWIEKPGYVGLSARIFDKNGIPISSEFLVNSYYDGYQGNPDISIDSNGNFVIVWESWQQDGDAYGIFARIYNQNGLALSQEFQINHYTDNDQMRPAVAMDNNGNFVVTWTSYGQDGDETGIFARRFDRNGNNLSSEFRVNFTITGWQDFSDISMDILGNFVICWHSNQNTIDSYNIMARTFNSTTTLRGPEFKVHNQSENWQIFPAIASDEIGNFIISWQSQRYNGGSFDIYARRFDQYGQSQDPEFRVNILDQYNQTHSDIFITDSEHYVIIWQSMEQIDSDWDIFAGILEYQTNFTFTPKNNIIKRHETKKNLHLPTRNSIHKY